MVIMCGVSKDGVVTGALCLSSNETLGKEKTYGENFKYSDFAGMFKAELFDADEWAKLFEKSTEG